RCIERCASRLPPRPWWAGPERAPDALRAQRQVAEPNAGEPCEGIRDRRAHRNQAALARALGAEGTAPVGVLHEAALEVFRRVVGAPNAIGEQRPVQQMT